MSQLDVYSQPFPSPDHTYAISPAKEKEEAAPDNTDNNSTGETSDDQTLIYRNRVSFSQH